MNDRANVIEHNYDLISNIVSINDVSLLEVVLNRFKLPHRIYRDIAKIANHIGNKEMRDLIVKNIYKNINNQVNKEWKPYNSKEEI